MPVLPRNRTRSESLPVILSGQRTTSFGGSGQLSGFVAKAKTAAQKLRTDIKTKRPGVLIPVQSTSLTTPHGMSIDAVHVIPDKPVNQRLSIDISR